MKQTSIDLTRSKIYLKKKNKSKSEGNKKMMIIEAWKETEVFHVAGLYKCWNKLNNMSRRKVVEGKNFHSKQ